MSPKTSQHVLHSNCLRETVTIFSGDAGLMPSDGGGKTDATMGVGAATNRGGDVNTTGWWEGLGQNNVH